MVQLLRLFFWFGQSDSYILICFCLIYNALWLGEVTFAKYLQTFIILPYLNVQLMNVFGYHKIKWQHFALLFPSKFCFISDCFIDNVASYQSNVLVWIYWETWWSWTQQAEKGLLAEDHLEWPKFLLCWTLGWSTHSNVNWPLHPVFPSPLYFITLSSPHWWESQLVMPPFLYSQDVLLKYLLTKQPAVTVFCFF